MKNYVYLQLEELRDRDPRGYGLLKKYVNDLYEALDQCDRNYPNSKQLHQSIDDPSIPDHSMGPTLTTLHQLEVVDIYSDTDPRQYDLKDSFDEERLDKFYEAIREMDC